MGLAAKAEYHRRYKADRGIDPNRVYGWKHVKWRRLILQRDPFCLDCQGAGRLTASNQAHHIVKPQHGGGSLDLENGMGLCARCHNIRTARGE